MFKLFKNFILKRVYKVECAFPIVISSESRMGQNIDGDHQEGAPHFNKRDQLGYFFLWLNKVRKKLEQFYLTITLKKLR